MAKAKGPSITERLKRQAGWIAVVLVVSSAMFVVGVLVGRGKAPISFAVDDLDVERQAERLQAEEEAMERYGAAGDSPIAGTDLRFPEDLRNSRPDAPALVQRSAPPPQPRTKPAPAVTPRPKAPPLPAEGAWTLQIAAVRDEAAADKMVAKLVTDGFPAFRTRVDIAGKGEWFRIRVGRFQDRDAARPTQSRLEKLGHRSLLIQNN